MISFRNFLAFLSVAWGAGAAALITSVWFSAYQNGGSILITINASGEAQLELFMFAIVIPIFAFGTYYALKQTLYHEVD